MPDHIKKRMVFLLLSGMGLVMSCTKDFLGKKPSSDLVVPTTLEDFQALLDNYIVMSETPNLGELSADNYYISSIDAWENLNYPKEHNAYIWAKDIYQGQGNVDDWNLPYQQVFYANVVLDGLPAISIDDMNRQQWNDIKGSACFIRAYAFYNLAQVFAAAYNGGTAASDPGIPLRLRSGINAVSTRASVKNTYDQILSDLQQASNLLPKTIPVGNLNRPSKPAALAMLARVYLSMGAYQQAGLYADSCLKAYAILVDFNAVDTIHFHPFTRPNAEILYESHMLTHTQLLDFGSRLVVDSNLYQSYAPNDLRRVVYYSFNGGSTGLPSLKASYYGGFLPFSGLAVDEIYLIRAECGARMADAKAALADLDTLLTSRWVSGTYTTHTVASTPDPLRLILDERRKELAFRGLRWTDLRRLNKEESANITLYRVLSGTPPIMDSLVANDENYVLPIPPDVLALSGIAQNPRH
jgi:starch-binding outer membrane protein, SusD/RagB family